MMQSDVGAPIERDRSTGRFDLPQRHNVVSVGYEHRWITRPLADDSPSKTVTKKISRAREVANTQPNVVDTAGAGFKFVCHRLSNKLLGLGKSGGLAAAPSGQ
jgi:hypothetical protein